MSYVRATLVAAIFVVGILQLNRGRQLRFLVGNLQTAGQLRELQPKESPRFARSFWRRFAIGALRAVALA